MNELETLLNDVLDDLEDIDTTPMSDFESKELLNHAIELLTKALDLI